MKSGKLTGITAMTLFAAVAIPLQAAAQDQQQHHKKQTHYTVKELGTLGGTSNSAASVNNKSWAVGDANLTGDATEHATLWRNGVITDLGTLGGLNSTGGPINETGLITGWAQTSTRDPLGENWGLLLTCNPSGPCQEYENLVRGFLWQKGVMAPLPTLGGNNSMTSFTRGVNDRGQVVGTAETATQDPNCIAPQVFDFEAVIWGPRLGEVHELPPFPGDFVGAAFGIDDKGQAVGGSGICAFTSFANFVHAVLWQDGRVTDLGSLGGVMNNLAFAINNRGQVVGISDLPGDTTTHAFLWQNGAMTDLGTLPGDFLSFPSWINDKGQVVGQSCDQSGNCRAFLWQGGVMTDLNTLTPLGSSLYLLEANSINSEGEIVGFAFDQRTGETLGFLATPTCDGDAKDAACNRDDGQDASWVGQVSGSAPKVILPESVRKLLRRRKRFRSTASGQDVWNGGSGNWSQGSQWSTGNPPTNGQDALIDNLNNAISNVTVDLTGVCANLTIDPDDSLTIGPVAGLTVYGSTLNNSSTMTIASGNGLALNSTVTLTGAGTVVMNSGSRVAGSGNSGSVPVLINFNNAIHGAGQLGLGQVQIMNQSLIDSNNTSAPLVVQSNNSGVTNTGTMQASGGGQLQLTAGFLTVPFNNTGGTIQALNGSTVQLAGYTYTGGTFSTGGSGIFQVVPGNNTILNNVTITGSYNIVSGGNTELMGTLTNNGLLQESGGGLLISGNVTLKGSGSVTGMAGGLLASVNGASSLTNQETIQGGGTIGDASLTVTNQATIIANNTSANLVLTGAAGSNTGLMEATGGATLEIRNTLNNNGGTIQAQNGSMVLLSNGTVSGGTLSTSGSGAFETISGTLDGTVNIPTNAGLFTVANGNNLTLKGTINNTGTIALLGGPGGGCLVLSAPVTLTGAGQVTMSPNTCFLGGSPTDTLTNKSTISGAGSIGDSNQMGITNMGTITANQASPLAIVPAANLGFLNSGKLVVNPGSTLNIVGLFKNFSSGTMSRGTYSIAGTMTFQNANIVTNGSNLTLTGGGQILDSVTSNNALANFATNKSNGIVSLTLGQALKSSAASFSNAGKITVDTTSSLTVGGSYTQTAGTTTIDGTLNAPTGVNLQAGSLFGKGSVLAAVASNGTGAVTAGDSSTKPGILSVTSYTQGATGVLNISIGGTTVGTKYGQLASSNGASLSGTLNIQRINGFVPAIGNTFTIITGNAITGQFTTVNGLSINSSEHFQINYNATTVTLTVVSGP